jgi:hypothetical protein
MDGSLLRLIDTIIHWAITTLKIPELAIRMFRVSNSISSISKKNLPTELIPLNTIQLSRGLLNFTVFQSIHKWILPYWAVKQYDPNSTSFIPRSHSGLSINITNRNWTAAGNMECANEPIVDPAGLIMPFRNGWSIDFWLQVDDEIFFPSYAKDVKQRLINDLPVVENSYSFNSIEFTQTVYSQDSILQAEVKLSKHWEKKGKCRLILSIRPFNPEGISLVNEITYIEDDNCFHVDDKKIFLSTEPKLVYCSDYNEGDSVKILQSEKEINKYSSHCSYGLANAIAVFEISEEDNYIYFHVPLAEGNAHSSIKSNKGLFNGDNKVPDFTKEDVLARWELLLGEGTQFNIPDNEMTSVIRTSLSTLLMFIDNNSITPGPFTYHQFWFRDAAFMLSALDTFNYTHYTEGIIKNFPAYQERDGYFRSQKGEWDSNGQAVWMIYRHFLVTGNTNLLKELFPSMVRGIKWIDNKRVRNSGAKDKYYYGLMPKGLSAEHLGLADYYFWDNFWSLAGIRSFIEICRILNCKQEEIYANGLYNEYLESINTAVNFVQKKFNAEYITAATGRDADYGMIGSIIPLYPLQLNDFETKQTLTHIYDNFMIKGMFYQNFIHSGLNPYLTIQLAHSYLFKGDRRKFNELFRNTLKKRTTVNNFPEAIHPSTGGGCMGDGHHGWAAAEIVSAFRDAFLWEDENKSEIRIFSGIPAEWFKTDFMMKGIPTSKGLIDLDYTRIGGKIKISIKIKFRVSHSVKVRIILPFEIAGTLSGQDITINDFNETEISFPITSSLSLIEAEVIKTHSNPVKTENT